MAEYSSRTRRPFSRPNPLWRLLAGAPIGDVDAIDVAPTGLAKSVMLRVRGTASDIETARGQPAEALPRALERTRTTDATPGREVA